MPRKRILTDANTFICQLCGKPVIKLVGLGSHLANKHGYSDPELGEYYKKYFNIDPDCDKCAVCGKITKFLDLRRGFGKFCSNSCRCAYTNAQRKIKNENKIIPVPESADEFNIVLFGEKPDFK